MQISYNWLKRYIKEIPSAEETAKLFELHLCEVEFVEKNADGDTIFDLNILPNRAHDLLCHAGVAKELSGLLGVSFEDPNKYITDFDINPTNLKINIETPACRRYMGRIVRGVNVSPSPDWLRESLESIGQRSINNIVDATNLVMFDIGQPAHAYDIGKLQAENGKLKVVIKNVNDDEEFETVGGEKIVAKLKNTDMVVSDGKKTLAIAGVKGGTNSGISDDTKDIVLEVANFDPVSVRKTARRLGLLSDSAKRFENDFSPEITERAMMKLSSLIAKLCPDASFEEVVDTRPTESFGQVYPQKQEERKIMFSMERISKKLGITISDEEAEKILQNYAYTFTRDGDTFTLSVPVERLDLTGEHDMSEEFGRIVGYEKIDPQMPKINFAPQLNETKKQIDNARAKLIADGYSEVMTYSLVKKGQIEIARASKGKEFLRTNLANGLTESYEMNRLNAPLLGVDGVKIFEIGTVFPEKDKEEIHVAYVNEKGVVESTLEEFVRDIQSLEDLPISESDKNTFTMWSIFPFITRDIAVWVPEETQTDELIDLYKNCAGDLLVRTPYIFDSFSKDGKKSIAIRLVFQSYEKTLTDEEIGPIMQKIESELQQKGYSVR